MAFFEVHVYNDLEYFLQELASSLSFWKRCKFSSNIKTSCQISSWSYCAYIVVLLSKKFGILWRMAGKLLFFSSKNKTPRGRCNIILWNWTSIPHVILLHTQHLFWNKMAFGWSLRNYSGKYPVQNDRNNWLRREHKSFILNKWNRSPKGEWVFRNNKQGRLSLFNRNIPCVKFFFCRSMASWQECCVILWENCYVQAT